jgi:large subunit ribosomal protein L30
MAIRAAAAKKGATPAARPQTATPSSGKMLKIRLVRSLIHHPLPQREVVKGLGLRKIHSEVVRPDRPEVWGMIRKVAHLVAVEVVESK